MKFGKSGRARNGSLLGYRYLPCINLQIISFPLYDLYMPFLVQGKKGRREEERGETEGRGHSFGCY
jgi:hypothetical protein